MEKAFDAALGALLGELKEFQACGQLLEQDCGVVL